MIFSGPRGGGKYCDERDDGETGKVSTFDRLEPFAGIVGTGIAIAATQNRRDYYDNGYYGGGPAYYGGGGDPTPYYYSRNCFGCDPYYRPRW